MATTEQRPASRAALWEIANRYNDSALLDCPPHLLTPKKKARQQRLQHQWDDTLASFARIYN